MQLSGRAGQKGAWSTAVSPSAGQARHAPCDHVTGEVLLANTDRSVLPYLPELVQIWQQHVPQHTLHGEVREQPVEHGLGAWFVHLVQGPSEGLGGVDQVCSGTCLRTGSGDLASWLIGDGRACCLSGCQSVGLSLIHISEPTRQAENSY